MENRYNKFPKKDTQVNRLKEDALLNYESDWQNSINNSKITDIIKTQIANDVRNGKVETIIKLKNLNIDKDHVMEILWNNTKTKRISLNNFGKKLTLTKERGVFMNTYYNDINECKKDNDTLKKLLRHLHQPLHSYNFAIIQLPLEYLVKIPYRVSCQILKSKFFSFP